MMAPPLLKLATPPGTTQEAAPAGPGAPTKGGAAATCEGPGERAATAVLAGLSADTDRLRGSTTTTVVGLPPPLGCPILGRLLPVAATAGVLPSVDVDPCAVSPGCCKPRTDADKPLLANANPPAPTEAPGCAASLTNGGDRLLVVAPQAKATGLTARRTAPGLRTADASAILPPCAAKGHGATALPVAATPAARCSPSSSAVAGEVDLRPVICDGNCCLIRDLCANC